MRGYFVKNFGDERQEYIMMGGEGELIPSTNRNIACWIPKGADTRIFFKRPVHICRESLEWNILRSAIDGIEDERDAK